MKTSQTSRTSQKSQKSQTSQTSQTSQIFGRVRLLALLSLLALAAPGCAATQRKVEPLEDSVRVYNDGVRWQRFDDSASRLPPARRDDFLDERDQLHEDLRVSDYEIIRVRHHPKGRQARVQVKYTWYLESRGKVHETHAVQTWHQGKEVWILRGERFLRGEPMPGLEGDEPKPDDPDDPDEAPASPGSSQTAPGVDADLPESDDAPEGPAPEGPAPEEAAEDPPQGS